MGQCANTTALYTLRWICRRLWDCVSRYSLPFIDWGWALMPTSKVRLIFGISLHPYCLQRRKGQVSLHTRTFVHETNDKEKSQTTATIVWRGDVEWIRPIQSINQCFIFIYLDFIYEATFNTMKCNWKYLNRNIPGKHALTAKHGNN